VDTAVERAFGCLLNRWRVLKTASNFPYHTTRVVINACVLLQNFCLKHPSTSRWYKDIPEPVNNPAHRTMERTRWDHERPEDAPAPLHAGVTRREQLKDTLVATGA